MRLPPIPGRYGPSEAEIEAILAADPPPIRPGPKAPGDDDPLRPSRPRSRPATDWKKRLWILRANVRRNAATVADHERHAARLRDAVEGHRPWSPWTEFDPASELRRAEADLAAAHERLAHWKHELRKHEEARP